MNLSESFAGIDVSSQTEVVTDLMGIAEIEFNPENYQANLDKAEAEASLLQGGQNDTGA